MTDAGRERCPECQVVGGHHPECPEDRGLWPNGWGQRKEHPNTLAPTLASCPHCGEPDVVRLADDWQERLGVTSDPATGVLRAKEAIPIIGCGNPWHYATRTLADAPMAKEDQKELLARLLRLGVDTSDWNRIAEALAR